ncbi:MAG: type IV toxin-antitoxin system AbiEi family antitoxin [Planctomycetes bacterium]|nr:type IV toxin-antitoxin system AbiEi family antitoxin [Planctomycetota bacterium]
MARHASSPPGFLSGLVDRFQAGGRYTFTREEVVRETKLSAVAVESALRRLRAAGRIATLRRGLYVIVPVEYRTAGAPPPPWFVDDLMRFLGQPYYVGLLSAAALHGAAHQQPMVFQVVTDRPTRPARVGRSRIVFHAARNVQRIPAVRKNTETGTLLVATPEATAFDLVRFSAAAGQWSHVATILSELGDSLSGDALVLVAAEHAVPDTQRLGYLLELVGEGRCTQALARWLAGRRFRPVVLAPGRRGGKAKPDSRWRVIPNAEIEVDG